MSRYSGNWERCRQCGMAYREFRCSIPSFAAAMDLLKTGDWRYKRRGTVLGYWHMVKRQEWARHQDLCQRQAAFEAEQHGDAWEGALPAVEEKIADTPF